MGINLYKEHFYESGNVNFSREFTAKFYMSIHLHKSKFVLLGNRHLFRMFAIGQSLSMKAAAEKKINFARTSIYQNLTLRGLQFTKTCPANRDLLT